MVTGWRSGDDDGVRGDGSGGWLLAGGGAAAMRLRWWGDHKGGGSVVEYGVGWRWGSGEAAGGRNMAGIWPEKWEALKIIRRGVSRLG
ncbi:hypothetical protein Tco_1382539 [Tanacetum coccineum]